MNCQKINVIIEWKISPKKKIISKIFLSTLFKKTINNFYFINSFLKMIEKNMELCWKRI